FQGGNSLGEGACVAKLSSKPDLVELLVTPFSPIVLNEKPGDSFTVKDAVANRGLGTAPSSKVRYYLSTDSVKSADDIRLTGTRSVPSLAPGAPSFPSPAMTVRSPRTPPSGTSRVLAGADDTRAAREVDETNTCGAPAGGVRVSLPDLQKTSVTTPPANANPGQNFAVTDTVQNFGTVAAG